MWKPVRKSHQKYGYIDHAGHYVIEPQFEEAYAFSEGLAQVVTTNHVMGFIDKTGAFVIPPRSLPAVGSKPGRTIEQPF